MNANFLWECDYIVCLWLCLIYSIRMHDARTKKIKLLFNYTRDSLRMNLYKRCPYNIEENDAGNFFLVTVQWNWNSKYKWKFNDNSKNLKMIFIMNNCIRHFWYFINLTPCPDLIIADYKKKEKYSNNITQITNKDNGIICIAKSSW